MSCFQAPPSPSAAEMCVTRLTLYECAHSGPHICQRPCVAFGFDYIEGRCHGRHETPAGYFKRKGRCVRCRERNKPRDDPSKEKQREPKSWETHEGGLARKKYERSNARASRDLRYDARRRRLSDTHQYQQAVEHAQLRDGAVRAIALNEMATRRKEMSTSKKFNWTTPGCCIVC